LKPRALRFFLCCTFL